MSNGENLGAQFTIDIADLKAGLAQANRLIRESESEFIEAAAGMEDWSKSAKGLEKRVKTLSKQVDIQQEKVSALVEEKERIIKTMTDEGKSHEEIEKAVDGVNKSIQREGKQLDTLKGKLNSSKSSLEKLESAAEGAGDSLDDMGKEADGAKDATGRLTDEIEAQKKQLDALAREYSNAVLEQGEMSDEARRLKKQIEGLNDELEANERKLDGASSGIGGLGKGAKDAGDGFSLAKVAVGGFVAGGLTALVGMAGNAISSMMELAESTRETRTGMAQLETAFESADLAGDDAIDTFVDLFGVLGDEGKAKESAAFLAKYADDEKELAEQTRILTGVFAEYQDSIPTEGLAEGIAATIEMSEVQGVLADALEWQGINLDDFNKKLGKLKTEKEREALITETLIGLYGESADAFMENNAAVIEAQEATANYDIAMANLGGKVEPLNTAMTNLKTTLVEAVTPAVGSLAEGAANLITSLTTAKEETDLLSESQRASVTAAQESAAAYQENKEAADAYADSQVANLEYGGQLLEQLKGLVDENGKVKAGEEERAEFIMGQLNEALGTEYTKLSQIVDANGQVKDSVYDVIEAKKAQILMEAYEESYRQAVLNVAGAEKARAIQAQEIAAQEAVADEAYKAAKDARIELDNKVANAKNESDLRSLASEQRMVQSLEIEAQKQAGILTDKQNEYNKTEDVLYGYYSDIENYETANTLLMEGETDKAVKHLNKLGDGFMDTASTAELAADEQYKVLEQQVIDTEVNAELMKEAYEDGVEGVSEEMVKTAKEQADAAKEEFYKVGGDITKGIAEGAEDEEWTLKGTLKSLVSKAVAAAKKAAGIESPSKLFRDEVGHWMGEGVAVGIEGSTKDVVKSVDKQVNAALDAYDVGEINAAIAGGVNASAGKKSGPNGLASGSNGGVTVYQTNNYSQAHSRFELYKSKQATAAAVRLALGGA